MLVRSAWGCLQRLGDLGKGLRRRSARSSRFRRRVFLEPLEPRLLLAHDYSVSGTTIEFQPASEIYLRVAGGILEHSPDGQAYEPVTSADNQPLAVSGASHIVAAPGTTLIIAGMDQGGGAYEADNLILQQGFVTQGQDLSFQATNIQVVAGAGAGQGVIFDTRSNTGPGGNIKLASEILGVDRSTLYAMVRRHNIPR